MAALITVGLILGVVLWSRPPADSSRDVSPAETSDSPEDCLNRMFRAAQHGQVDEYLACFTGPEKVALLRQLDELTAQAFAESLQAAMSDLKGRAVYREPAGTVNSEAQLRVERIYTNHMERQLYQLVREDHRWRIARVTTRDAFPPYRSYGTPIGAE